MIGNNDASKLSYDLCSSFKRFVIVGDYVPFLPPFIFGYRHFSEKIKLDKVNSKIIDHYLYHAVNNHKILNYIKSLMIWTMENEAVLDSEELSF
jgi:hypothetical protein